MNLSNIERKLKQMGYSPFLQQNLKILYSGIDNAYGENIPDTITQITIKEGKYTCLYFNRNMPIEKTFGSVEELLNYIKEKFPIK